MGTLRTAKTMLTTRRATCGSLTSGKVVIVLGYEAGAKRMVTKVVFEDAQVDCSAEYSRQS